jgi:mitochondrial fission protein ELM1
MRVCGLIDARVGSSKQTISLAEELNAEAVLKNISYNSLIKIPNFLRPKKVGIDFTNSDDLTVKVANDTPDIIVFAGRRLAGLALYLKKNFLKHFNKDVKLISILNPNYSFKNFFCVILPKHDGVRGENVLSIRGALCKFDFEKIEQERVFWRGKLAGFNTPYISLMIGGDTKDKKFNSEKLGIMVGNLSKKVKEIGGTLLVSSSRRTSQECVGEIEKNLNCENYFFKWTVNTELNPYYGFLTLSDVVVITGESISMICEALTLKKSVLVYRPNESLSLKHREFCEDLVKDGLVGEVDCQVKKLDILLPKGINELERVRNEILLKIDTEMV